MITILDGLEECRAHAILFHAMLRQRARVFGPGGLGWDVRIVWGKERDELDVVPPIYVVAHDDIIRGSLRLLPTTGPTLLEKVFPESAPARISSPEIWEMSRLCTESGSLQGRSSTMLELFDAVGELARRSGISSIIGNVSRSQFILYRNLRLPMEVLGTQGGTVLISMPVDRTHAVVIERIRRDSTNE